MSNSKVRMAAKERAFSLLQRWIVDGTLKPGEKIYDGKIAQELGISRTPIREALKLLEVQGLIKTHPGRETRVTLINKEDIFKLYPPLASIQGLAAEEAGKVITADQIDRLKMINSSYEKAIINDPFKALECDEEFHDFIIDIADNPYIADFSSVLQLHIRRFKYLFLKKDLTIRRESLKEHEALLQAFTNGDIDSACSIMKQNWLRPMEEVYQLLINN